jgi:hypothetical protein
MKYRACFLLAGGMAVACASHAQEKFLVQVPAVFDTQANVGSNIRGECEVDNLVGNHVYGKVSEHFPGTLPIKDPAKAGPDKVLTLTILTATGAGGGAWSGAKRITLRADLMQNGQLIRSLVKQRHSRGGVFSLSGTCAILERDAQALGMDVVLWLKRPSAVVSDTLAKEGMDTSAMEKNPKEAGSTTPSGETPGRLVK